jgi:hypothetical protein
MATHMVPRAEWASSFDSFSRDHLGETATLEVLGTDLGDQVLASNQTFRGISADEKDGENQIAIMVGPSMDDGTTHMVISPTEVWFKDAEEDSGEAIEIRATDSTTLLSFAPLMELPASGTES